MNQNLESILSEILGCGTADVPFFLGELEVFNVDFSEIWEEANEIHEKPTLNDLLYLLYLTVCRRHNIDEERYSIFTNCLDSHLNIDSEECYREADVIAKATSEYI